MKCYCGSGKIFSTCCEPIIANDTAKSPEQLMRSRYTAFATGNMGYVYKTYSSLAQSSLDKSDFVSSCEDTKWCGLTVENTQENTVEFKAYSLLDGQLYLLHELSFFQQEDGFWRYHDGKILFSVAVKIPRNASCICGSGKKYKRCCMMTLSNTVS